MKFSYGFVETKGYVAAIEAADAMVKAAKIEVVSWRKAGGALVMVIIKGELGACRAAVDAGSAAAERIGQLVSANVIPNPYGDTEILVDQYLGGRKKKQAPQMEKESQIPRVKPQVSLETTKPQKVKPVPVTKYRQLKKPSTPKIAVKKKTPPSSPQERLLNFITSAPLGITIKQLSANLNKPAAEIRKDLKELMYKNAVEKVQQRYFIVEQGSKK